MCFANKDRLFTRMSRVKSRTQTEICGDCCATDPSWASINRGILLCSDCASIHRSLGRHISLVKSLRQGTWCPSVLNYVNSLNAHGANSVWEHCLVDSTSGGSSKNIRRKPNPKDQLHPVKSDFIKAKHVNLSFVLKSNIQEEGLNNIENELSKQLHASVRTSNLETSLRLVVQGADPNFFHDEKRSTPLHVAAKFGQASQIELLLVYGAQINVVDGNGQTPIEVAKNNNHNTIAERLIEAMYEVTDRITLFLGGKKPDHTSGKHLKIPEQNCPEISEQLKIARGKLQLVPNKMFEELVMDLYDEVDRRENEAVWATSALNPDIGSVPFLPANPYLSATRNQGRQKLARFSPVEFAGLLTDVLIDARRRQNMANLRPIDSPAITSLRIHQHNNQRGSNLSDDEPLYDAVASDDDYAALAPIAQQAIVNQSPVTVSNDEVENLRMQLFHYISEVNQLKNVVQQLSFENTELKSKCTENSQTSSYNNIYDVPLRIELNASETETETEPVPDGSSSSNQSTAKRPVSMYETRLGPQGKINECRTTTSMYQMAGDKPNEFLQSFAEEVRHRTDIVTRRLKEICVAMQDITNKDAFVPCAERIRVAVAELIAIFPPQNCNELIKGAIKQLNLYTGLIQHECENLQKSISTDDTPAIDAFMQEVRDCALHIASATKTLVMQFQ